jgi:hypothetical protein
MTRRTSFALFLACTYLYGCLPEKKIVWSPDGTKAAVSAGKGLYFVDPAGRVLSPRLDGESIRVAWFEDGNRLVVVRPTEVNGWKDVAGVLNAAQIADIKSRSEDLRRRILAYSGDWDKFEIDPEQKLTPGMGMALLAYVRDNAAAGLQDKLGSKWNEFAELKPSIWHLQIYELAEKELRPGKILLRTLEQILMPSVAPGGKAIAYLRRTQQNPGALGGLFAISVDGGPELRVAENVAVGYDWSPDGRSLAFIHAPVISGESDSKIQLGALSTAVVAGSDGKPAASVSHEEDRAGLLFNVALQVDWLADGRLMFSSVEVSLPVTARDMPQRWSIFVVDPKNPATVHRVLARDFTRAMEMGDPRFELSPDERRVVIPGPGGELNVYDFAGGETTTLESPANTKLVSFPSWRNKDSFVFARSPAKDAKENGQAMIWQDGKLSSLSDHWPAELTEWMKKDD